MTTSTPDPLLRGKQAAELLGVTADTVARWAREGVLPFVKTAVGGHRRYRRSDVLELAQRMNPDEATA